MTERNKTIDEIIDVVQNMEWGVMDNDIDAKELLMKLNALKNIVDQPVVSGQVCGTCGSKDVTDWNTYFRCNECDSRC